MCSLEPICTLLVPSPSVFAYYSGMFFRGSEAEKEHLWQMDIKELFVFVLIYSWLGPVVKVS